MIRRTGLVLIAALGAVFPAVAEPFHHPYGEWREYHRDWLAACPDAINEDATDFYGVSCFASTGSAELNSAGLPAYKLTIMRNRLSGDMDVAITLAADKDDTDMRRPLTLSFGGGLVESFDFETDLETRYNTTNQFYIADPVRKAKLLDLMSERNAVTLGLPLTTPLPNKQVRLSLRGVLASIDFMATYSRRVADY